MKITKIKYKPLMPASGILLISDPFKNEGFFHRTVVLITGHHPNDGSVGFVLNISTTVNTQQVLPNHFEMPLPVYHGGPVEEDTFHFIYRGNFALTDSVQVTNNIYWGGDVHELNHHLTQGTIKPANVKCFIGYSGWDKGQLQNEIDQSAWWTKPVLNSASLFCTPPSEMWAMQVKSMGNDFVHLANPPEAPEWN